jgi:hypothetical protein
MAFHDGSELQVLIAHGHAESLSEHGSFDSLCSHRDSTYGKSIAPCLYDDGSTHRQPTATTVYNTTITTIPISTDTINRSHLIAIFVFCPENFLNTIID